MSYSNHFSKSLVWLAFLWNCPEIRLKFKPYEWSDAVVYLHSFLRIFEPTNTSRNSQNARTIVVRIVLLVRRLCETGPYIPTYVSLIAFYIVSDLYSYVCKSYSMLHCVRPIFLRM